MGLANNRGQGLPEQDIHSLCAAVYVGVQNLENTGVDKRVDIILTEAGFEFMMPESHAIWK